MLAPEADAEFWKESKWLVPGYHPPTPSAELGALCPIASPRPDRRRRAHRTPLSLPRAPRLETRRIN
jgi:hypothetical protein